MRRTTEQWSLKQPGRERQILETNQSQDRQKVVGTWIKSVVLKNTYTYKESIRGFGTIKWVKKNQKSKSSKATKKWKNMKISQIAPFLRLFPVTLASLHSADLSWFSCDLREATFIFFACSRMFFSCADTACGSK